MTKRGTLMRAQRSVIAAATCLALISCSGSDTPGDPSPSESPSGASAGSHGTTSDSPVDTVTAAAERTFEQGSMHVDGGFSVEAQGLTIGFDSAADVDVDADRMSATASFDSFPGIPDGTEMEMVIIGSTVWMRSALFDESIGADSWMTFDANEAAESNPQLAGLGSGMNDPRTAGNFLAGADRMRASGEEERHGESMSRYDGLVDFEKALVAASEEQRPGIRTALEGIRPVVGTSVAKTTVWIDAQGYVREVTYRFVARPGSPAAGATMSMFSVISGIGQEFVIEEPTENVVELPSS